MVCNLGVDVDLFIPLLPIPVTRVSNKPAATRPDASDNSMTEATSMAIGRVHLGLVRSLWPIKSYRLPFSNSDCFLFALATGCLA